MITSASPGIGKFSGKPSGSAPLRTSVRFEGGVRSGSRVPSGEGVTSGVRVGCGGSVAVKVAVAAGSGDGPSDDSPSPPLLQATAKAIRNEHIVAGTNLREPQPETIRSCDTGTRLTTPCAAVNHPCDPGGSVASTPDNSCGMAARRRRRQPRRPHRCQFRSGNGRQGD